MLELIAKPCEVDSELTLELVQITARPVSLMQLKPPYGQSAPSKENTVFFPKKQCGQRHYQKREGLWSRRVSSLVFGRGCQPHTQSSLRTV